MNEIPEVPAPPLPRRRTTTVAIGALGAVGIATSAVFGVHAALDDGTWSSAARTTAPVLSHGGGFLPGAGSPGGAGPSAAATAAGTATADQVVGVVDVTTVLGYRDAEAAGTGMVLTSDGEVLTNNHVVEGATSITVTVLSTGESYSATVVGTAPSQDVAVLQLTGAAGLTTVPIDDDGGAAVGDSVTAVGNAGGDPTSTSAATGTVTALDRSITASDETGSDAEQLTGLIETDADVQAGDSGGPLLDAEGEVVGMDTAASTGGAVQSYAIPIGTALDLAGQITAGVDDATVHQGLPAFLGVSVQAAGNGGAAVAGVVPGGPAATAGLAAGDVITSVGGTSVTAPEDLTTALSGADPGDQVSVTWTGTAGTGHSATVTLATGPAD